MSDRGTFGRPARPGGPFVRNNIVARKLGIVVAKAQEIIRKLD